MCAEYDSNLIQSQDTFKDHLGKPVRTFQIYIWLH